MKKEEIPTINPNNHIVELSGALIRQEENIVLKDVNFAISKGEFIYIIGRVGSGKSSLLKTLYAELKLTEGEGFASGYDLTKIKRKDIPFLRRKTGIIFQDFQLLIDRSVYDNLYFVLHSTGWRNKKDMDKRIRDVLTKVDMVHKGYKMPHQLSGGEQQRIAIARALLNEPDLVLADEPTGNIDPETSDDLLKLLHKICEDGKTVIMATHNHNLIKKFPARTFKCEDTRLNETKQEEIDFDVLI
ncbi:MAG: ATP-binding cassette domain-containing protein [Marinilabiliaceae bacterium]|nr:ATP-binding cassette domain-containing protein [Marinilabiliaceae bacterium]